MSDATASRERAPLLERDVEATTTRAKDADDGLETSTTVTTAAPAIACGLWFYTNIANNIALQVYRDAIGFGEAGDDARTNAWRLEASATTTCAQMAIGVVLGVLMKLIFRSGRPLRELLRETDGVVVGVGVLHGTGAILTNLGFLFTTAAFVQIVKLSEPFMVLLFEVTMKCSNRMPLNVSLGAIIAVCVVVWSALDLALLHPIDDKKASALVMLIIASVVITYRIVWQKTSRLMNLKRGALGDVLDEYLYMTFYAFWLVLAVVGVAYAVDRDQFVDVPKLVDNFRVDLVVYHPVWYYFSLATLSYVAPITHALLNVIKRIAGLLCTLVFFQESVTSRAWVGIIGALIGGVWYSLEKHAASHPDASFFSVALFRCFGPPTVA